MPLKQFYTFICRELIFPVIASDKMYLLCFLKGRNFPFAAVSFHCQVGTGMDEMVQADTPNQATYTDYEAHNEKDFIFCLHPDDASEQYTKKADCRLGNQLE